MAQYIDKSAVIAETEKIREQVIRLRYAVDANCIVTIRNACECLESSIDSFVNSIDTLEVKEVDEVKIGETQIYLEDDGGEQPYDGKQWLDLSCTEYEIPKALFKDGDNVEILIRKAQKGE